MEKVPVVAVVAAVGTVLSTLSVGVLGVVDVDCNSAIKVVGVVLLSKKYRLTLKNTASFLHYNNLYSPKYMVDNKK